MVQMKLPVSQTQNEGINYPLLASGTTCKKTTC